MPKVSVIMPVYNEKEYMIQEAIDSVIGQTFTDWELVIVCDNINDDNIKHFLLSVKDERVRVLFNENHLGEAGSRNKGIGCAKGEYIAIFDADDVCELNRLDEELHYLEDESCDMVCGARYLIDEKGNELESSDKEMTEKKLRAYLIYLNNIYHSTVLIKKSVLEVLGGYRDYLAVDYELWLRVSKKGYKIGYIDKKLIKYRVRENSITGKNLYLQTIDCAYFRKLYRQNKILNAYDEKDYKNYVHKFLKNRDKAISNFEKCVQKRKKFTERVEQKKYVSAICEYVGAVLGSRIYRLNIYNSIRFKLFLLMNRGM